MFPNRPLHAGTSVPQETKYQRAAKEWDDRIGSARVQARNWRFFALALLCYAGVLTAGFVYEADRTHVLPVVIPVNKLGKTGRITFPGNRYNPTEAEISQFLKTWIKHFFSESTDPVVFSQNIHSAFAHLTGSASTYVQQWAQKHPPNKDLGKRAVSVQIDSILPRDKHTYQVQWTKRVYKKGAIQSTHVYTGLFTITEHIPHSEAKVKVNPLGLYISNVSWSRQY